MGYIDNGNFISACKIREREFVRSLLLKFAVGGNDCLCLSFYGIYSKKKQTWVFCFFSHSTYSHDDQAILPVHYMIYYQGSPLHGFKISSVLSKYGYLVVSLEGRLFSRTAFEPSVGRHMTGARMVVSGLRSGFLIGGVCSILLTHSRHDSASDDSATQSL